MIAPGSLVESRVVRIAIAVTAALALGWLLLRDEQPRALVDAYEAARVRTITSARTAAIRTERCQRPALRTPAVAIDGTPLLAGLVQKSSPELSCLERVSKERTKQEPCDKPGPCARVALAAVVPQPEIVAACAPLYDKIAKTAYTTEACSPSSVVDHDPTELPSRVVWLPFAIKLQVAPLYASGDLLAAARRVLDAMRFLDDYGRKGYLLHALVSAASAGQLADLVAEILRDPRLTTDEARAIARDLDVLIDSMPTIDAILRQESRFSLAQREINVSMTGDRDQDAVLQMIGVERWLERVETACRNRPMRSCVEAFRTQPEPQLGEHEERVERALAASTDRERRERLLQIIEDDFGVFNTYPAMLADRRFARIAVRMQAELRTLTAEQCRDPYTRRATLARWREDAVVGEEPAPSVAPPDWLRLPDRMRQKAEKTRTLRCAAGD